MDRGDLNRQALTAGGDAWQVEGRLREAAGGGAADLRDLRLSASGLPRAAWNTGDVTGPRPDLEGARAFYAERGVPWGVRVPAGAGPVLRRQVLRQRVMGLPAPNLRAAAPVTGLELRLAGAGDVDTVVDLDAAGFGEAHELTRSWIEPHLGARGFETALATLAGETVGVAYTLRSDGRAGPALYLGGVTVLPHARRRGVATALSSWLLERGFAAGAQLAHLHADDEASARVYARLGFVDAGELDVYEGL